MSSWVNEIDDSLSTSEVAVYVPCQPIGCDNGFHLPGCVYEEADKDQDAQPEGADQ